MRTIRVVTIAAMAAIQAGTALAQEPEGVRLGLMYQPEYQPGLVVLPFAAEQGTEDMLQAIRGIIEQDLGFSDRFSMLSGAAGVTPGEPVNLELWKERGADWVLDGALQPGPAGGTMLRLVLHDAVYGTVKGDRTFVLPARGDPNFRMAVHAASDEVVFWATGDPGAAASRIAFVLDARDGSKEMYIIDYDGENVQRITSDGAITLSPAWSPDGRRIA